MRILCLATALAALPFFAVAQNLYGYYQGKRVEYCPAGDQLVVRLPGGPAGKAPATEAMARLRDDPRVRQLGEVDPRLGVAFLTFDPAKVANAAGFARELRQTMPEALSVSPVLAPCGGKADKPGVAWLNEVIAKPAAKVPLARLQAQAQKIGLVFDRFYAFDSTIVILRTVDKNSLMALEAANQLYESGLASFAEPNWLTFVESTSVPNDPGLGEAWHLRNTGQWNGIDYGVPDADIDADEAWDITTGCPNIRIAIVGSGVQRNHPDLAPNILNGFDATGLNSNGGTEVVGVFAAHETLVAGIAAARGNNGIGSAGVAYNCRIVPIRGFLDGYLDFNSVTTSERLAAGIDWAWQQNRSDVINLSWFTTVGLNLITQAINNATTLGRQASGNNRGCVVVVGAGNATASTLPFPASLPNVIAVGATNNRDLPTHFTNWGAALDVMAPGRKFTLQISRVGQGIPLPIMLLSLALLSPPPRWRASRPCSSRSTPT
jgi:subtilisin family serine protease